MIIDPEIRVNLLESGEKGILGFLASLRWEFLRKYVKIL